MNADFWHRKWAENRIGFHQQKPHPLLLAHFDQLALEQGSRIFLPLCGKTLDIGWLLSNGYQVAGAELSEVAIEQLFEQLALKPLITQLDSLKRYSGPGINIFAGDIFDLNRAELGPVDAVFDRAALVALPGDVRIHYSQHLTNISQNAPQLLITFTYNQQQMDGPPFSVDGVEVQHHYADRYWVTLLEEIDMPRGRRGYMAEQVWLLGRSSSDE